MSRNLNTGLIFFTFGSIMFVTFSGYRLLKLYVLVDWERTEATIISSSVYHEHSRDGNYYELRCKYQFEVDGVIYKKIERTLPVEGSRKDRGNVELARKNFEKESKGRIEIMYNIKDPSESMVPTFSKTKKVWIVFGISLSSLLFLIVIWVFRHKIITPNEIRIRKLLWGICGLSMLFLLYVLVRMFITSIQ